MDRVKLWAARLLLLGFFAAMVWLFSNVEVPPGTRKGSDSYKYLDPQIENCWYVEFDPDIGVELFCLPDN